MLDRASAMGDEICNFDDEVGQSMLVQQEQNAIWRAEQHIFNTTEETDDRSESMEKRNEKRMTSWRCHNSKED